MIRPTNSLLASYLSAVPLAVDSAALAIMQSILLTGADELPIRLRPCPSLSLPAEAVRSGAKPLGTSPYAFCRRV